jgi:4-carboxymuconolactone decarboxylase
MTPRVPPVKVDTNPPAAAQGRPMLLNVTRTLAHQPDLLPHWRALGQALVLDQTLPGRERELVILRVAWRTRCEYEFGHHSREALSHGLSPAEIRAITGPSEQWPRPHERDLLMMTDQLLDSDNLSDSQWTTLSASWTPGQLIGLVMTVGYFRAAAVLINVLGVELEAGVAGWPAPNS